MPTPPTTGTATAYIDPSVNTALGLPLWFMDVYRTFQAVPFDIWGAIMWEESGFDPENSNTKLPDDSWGLFMLNRNGGQGKGYSPAYLKNPSNNAQIAYPAIKAAYDAYPDDVAQIAIHSGHPGLVDPSDPRVQRIVRTSNFIKAAGNPLSAAAQLLSGIHLPDIGSYLPTFPTGPAIGQGIVNAVSGSVKGWWKGVQTAGRDALIDQYAPATMLFVGINLVGFGLVMAAISSKPAQEAAGAAVALGPGPVKIAGAAVQTVGAGNTSGAQTIVRDRQRARRARP
jgi:hypothetical protein